MVQIPKKLWQQKQIPYGRVLNGIGTPKIKMPYTGIGALILVLK